MGLKTAAGDDLTDRQARIVDFIAKFTAENGYGPTVRDIKEAFGISSPNGVNCHLKALRKKGVLAPCNGLSRAIRLVAKPAPAGPTLEDLFAYVEAMVEENVKHRTKDFRLGEMEWTDKLRHLRGECEELAAAEHLDDAQLEMADVLGVLVHIAVTNELTGAELIRLCMDKLQTRFYVPKKKGQK